MTATQLIKQRHKLGLTQAQLATQLGVSRNTVVRWEIGMHPIPPMAIRLLATLKKTS